MSKFSTQISKYELCRFVNRHLHMNSYPALVWIRSALLVIEMNELVSWLTELRELGRVKRAYFVDMYPAGIHYTRSLRSFDLNSNRWLHHALEYTIRIQNVIGDVIPEVGASLYALPRNFSTFGTGSEGQLNRSRSVE